MSLVKIESALVVDTSERPSHTGSPRQRSMPCFGNSPRCLVVLIRYEQLHLEALRSRRTVDVAAPNTASSLSLLYGMCLLVDLRGTFWWLGLVQAGALTPPANVIYQTTLPSSNLPLSRISPVVAYAREKAQE